MFDLSYVRREFAFAGLAAVRPILARISFRLSAKKRAETLEFLGRYLQSRKPLDTALVTLRDRYADTGRPIEGMFREWTTGMSAGHAFSDVARGCFSSQELMIVAAGESSGSLDSAFLQAAVVARAGARMFKTAMVELSQPLLYLAVLLGMVIWFSLGLAPDLQNSVPASALSESQKSVFETTKLVGEWWHVGLAVLAVAVIGVVASMPNVRGEFRDRVLDKVPPWSIYKTYSGATLLIAIAALVKAGVPLDEAIRQVRRHASPWIDRHLGTMLRRLGNAAKPGVALDVGLLDDEMADLVAVYAATGAFDEAMENIGSAAIEAAVSGIQTKASIARVLVLAMLGWCVLQGMDTVLGITDAAQRASSANPAAQAARR